MQNSVNSLSGQLPIAISQNKGDSGGSGHSLLLEFPPQLPERYEYFEEIRTRAFQISPDKPPKATEFREMLHATIKTQSVKDTIQDYRDRVTPSPALKETLSRGPPTSDQRLYPLFSEIPFDVISRKSTIYIITMESPSFSNRYIRSIR